MKTVLEHNSQSHPVELSSDGPGKSYRIRAGESTAGVQILGAADGRLDLLIDGERIPAYVSSDNARRWVTVRGRTFLLTRSSGTRKNKGGHVHTPGELTAPMPGQVRAVNVAEGDGVTRGQTLLLLEAMKMEIRIQSPQAGVVKRVFVKHGQTVEREQVLIEIVNTLEG